VTRNAHTANRAVNQMVNHLVKVVQRARSCFSLETFAYCDVMPIVTVTCISTILRAGFSKHELTHRFTNQRLSLTLGLTSRGFFHAKVTRGYVTR